MSRSDDRGFSLLEVTVAFVIATMALTALIQLYSSSLRAAQRTIAITRAIEVAENRLAALTDPALLVPGALAGITDDGYGWRVEISRDGEQRPEAPLALLRIAVEVAAPGDDGPTFVSETARYALLPAEGAGQ